MAGPYDYTINIPQPPAQNFLQSLMGIRQLQQMEDQSALQQQQAAFAAQMQPLEMARIKAGIDASNASAAESAARRGLIGTQSEAAKFELSQRQEFQKELNDLSSDPSKWTSDNFMKLGIRFPQSDWINLVKARQSVPNKALMFGDNLAQQLVLSTQIGDTKTGQKLLDDAVNATKKDPELTSIAPKIEQLSKQYRDFPEQTSTIAAMGLQMLSPDRAKAMFSAMDERLKSEETQAKIEKARAETKETEAKTKTELAKLAPGGEKISDKQQSDINALTDEAVTARMNVAGVTDSVNELLKFAEQFPKEFKSGVEASFQNFFSSISGDTTRAQNLRASIQPYATKEWIAKAAGLKGSLSEKEGARLDKGAPDVMKAGPQELLSWARLVQKVELADADKKELNAAWQQNARSLQAKAPVKFEVAGITVEPGNSYQQVLTKLQAGYKKKSEQDVLDDAIRLKRIKEAEQTGRTPVPNMFNLGGAPQQQQPAYVPPSGVVIKSRK